MPEDLVGGPDRARAAAGFGGLCLVNLSARTKRSYRLSAAGFPRARLTGQIWVDGYCRSIVSLLPQGLGFTLPGAHHFGASAPTLLHTQLGKKLPQRWQDWK